MSVIIRLQNLPWSATAHDIRQYFHGLSIPEGGVHIVGGEKGDAFIAFSTDEDARQAFNRNNGKIKDAQISLLLSSRTEMQKVIEAARSRAMAALMGSSQPSIVPIMPAAVPTTANLSSSAKSGKKSGGDVQREGRSRRSRSRSRSHSSDRHERRDRRRERSRSGSRERGRDRRRRSRSRSRSRSRDRSRSRERRSNNTQNKRANGPAQPHRVGVWETPPQSHVFGNADSANLLASFVANNILPNILNGSGNVNQLAAIAAAGVNLQEQLQLQGNNAAFRSHIQSPPHQPNNALNFNASCRNERNLNDRDKDCDNSNKSMVQPNFCVKLFPFFGGIKDIEQFFGKSEFAKDGVRFSIDCFGNRNGQIYVNFTTARYKDDALSRSGNRIRNQNVVVDPVGADEFANMYLNPKNVQIPNEQRLDANNRLNVNDRPFTHLKIAALPNFADVQDVRNIFQNYVLAAIIFEPKGRIKSAYIKFTNSQIAQNALNDTKCHQFEGKPISVFICSDADFEDAARAQGVDSVPLPSNVFSMSGLPPKCSDRDIIDFFSDIGVMPAKISMVPNESGFIDAAICEFYNIDDAVLGFQKNGTLFGTNTVSLKYEPVNEAPKKSPPVAVQTGPPPGGHMGGAHNQQQPQQFHRPPMPPHGMNMNHPGNNHPNRPFFPNPNQFNNGPPMRGPRPPNNMPMQMNDMGRGMQYPMRRFPHPHHQNNHNNHHHQQQQQQMPPRPLDYDDNMCGDDDALAPPGCVLLMENIPYKAGVDEILNFLGSYNVSGDNVLRKFNANGLPSGEAKIIFNSPEEVYHIIQQNRGGRIRERLIHMVQI